MSKANSCKSAQSVLFKWAFSVKETHWLDAAVGHRQSPSPVFHSVPTYSFPQQSLTLCQLMPSIPSVSWILICLFLHLRHNHPWSCNSLDNNYIHPCAPNALVHSPGSTSALKDLFLSIFAVLLADSLPLSALFPDGLR